MGLSVNIDMVTDGSGLHTLQRQQFYLGSWSQTGTITSCSSVCSWVDNVGLSGNTFRYRLGINSVWGDWVEVTVASGQPSPEITVYGPNAVPPPETVCKFLDVHNGRAVPVRAAWYAVPPGGGDISAYKVHERWLQPGETYAHLFCWLSPDEDDWDRFAWVYVPSPEGVEDIENHELDTVNDPPAPEADPPPTQSVDVTPAPTKYAPSTAGGQTPLDYGEDGNGDPLPAPTDVAEHSRDLLEVLVVAQGQNNELLVGELRQLNEKLGDDGAIVDQLIAANTNLTDLKGGLFDSSAGPPAGYTADETAALGSLATLAGQLSAPPTYAGSKGGMLLYHDITLAGGGVARFSWDVDDYAPAAPLMSGIKTALEWVIKIIFFVMNFRLVMDAVEKAARGSGRAILGAGGGVVMSYSLIGMVVKFLAALFLASGVSLAVDWAIGLLSLETLLVNGFASGGTISAAFAYGCYVVFKVFPLDVLLSQLMGHLVIRVYCVVVGGFGKVMGA